jgi:hypothetical protein
MRADGWGTRIDTAYVGRDNLTSRPSDWRLGRRAASHSERKDAPQYHLDFEDAIDNFVRPHCGSGPVGPWLVAASRLPGPLPWRRG